MPVISLASIDDPRLDDYRNVPDPELLIARGLFVAEGRLVVRRLLERSRFAARSLMVTPAALEDFGAILPRFPDVPVYVVEQRAMNGVAGFNFHRGCLAVGLRRPPQPWRDVIAAASAEAAASKGAQLVVVLEQISNADNVGAIFRNAAAFGADAVLLEPSCTDPLYRKAIRTSMGAALQLPFATMTGWPADLAQLREEGFTIVALTPAEDAVSIDHWKGRPVRKAGAAALHMDGRRIALLLGHEGWGLSDTAMAAADVRVRIPMHEGTDSLNVATAAAIALYELRRPKP